jgi:hypothetical protein
MPWRFVRTARPQRVLGTRGDEQLAMGSDLLMLFLGALELFGNRFSNASLHFGVSQRVV